MLNDNNRDDMKKSIFMIDPSIAKTNQQESTIHENYSENYGLSALGIRASSVRRNLSPTVLIEKAIRNGEGILTDTGALAVTTGKFTGRSPHDKYIVDTDGVHDVINWGEVNRPIGRDVFNAIKEEMIAFLGGHEVYVFDGFAGADPKYRRKFRVINELPSQNLFIRDLLVRPTAEELHRFGEPDYTLLVAPGYKVNAKRYGINSEAAIMIDYEAHFAIIAGSQYSGEIKKTVFSIMNYAMPVEEDVLPMHCSCNMDSKTGDTAVFFGLSGTGKTTLSADPDRELIGDDEHVEAFDLSFSHRSLCNLRWIFTVPHGEDWHIYAFADNFQLINSSRSIDVACAKHWLFAVFLQPFCQFTAGGCLTCTLQTYQHINGKAFWRVRQLAAGSAH